MLELKGVSKRFVTDDGQVVAVHNLDLKLEEGELFALLGPSGCGKSTILRCVAGLETPDEGEIWIRDTCVFSSERKINIPPDARGVGLVFQSYAVWPHLTVYENVALPLQRGRNRIDKVDVEERVMRALTLVQMESMAQRPAPLLSGGQQQRVALARSLAYEPNLILLDEPLSNLDAKLRAEMRTELRELVKQLGLTGLYVTHDQEEALMMADRIGLMDGGVLRQAGDPQTIYERPADEFTARFVGQANLVEGVVLSELSGADGWLVKTAIGELTCGTTDELLPGQNVTVMFRPNHVIVSGEPGPDGRPNVFAGEVKRKLYAGDHAEFEVIGEGEVPLLAYGSPTVEAAEGETIYLEVLPEYVHVMRWEDDTASTRGVEATMEPVDG